MSCTRRSVPISASSPWPRSSGSRSEALACPDYFVYNRSTKRAAFPAITTATTTECRARVVRTTVGRRRRSDDGRVCAANTVTTIGRPPTGEDDGGGHRDRRTRTVGRPPICRRHAVGQPVGLRGARRRRSVTRHHLLAPHHIVTTATPHNARAHALTHTHTHIMCNRRHTHIVYTVRCIIYRIRICAAGTALEQQWSVLPAGHDRYCKL